MLGNYRVAAQLVASRVELSSIELVSWLDHVRTPQETHLWASIAYYEDSFPFLYVDDIRTSQKNT
jgi:hypothetical protein